MSRPNKNNADYHSHDKDMRNDKKIKALRNKFKHQGYSIYNMMLEVLDDCDYFKQHWDELNIELLAGDFEIEVGLLKEIIDYGVKIGLFIITEGYLHSNGHVNRFKPLLSKRKPIKNEVSDIGNLANGTSNGVSDVQNPHSIVKYSKKEKNNPKEVPVPTGKVNSKKQVVVSPPAIAGEPQPLRGEGKRWKRARPENPTTINPVQEYFSEKMKGKWAPARISVESEKFFNHYTANGWVQNKGKPIVNWKAAVNNWILNELSSGYSNPKAGSSSPTVSAVSQPPPEEKKLSEAEKMQLSRDFMQDCYTDFCEGRMLVKDGLTHYYNQLVMDGLLILSESDKERIKKEANGDLKMSKLIAVEEFFNRMKTDGRKNIYELSK